MVARRMVGMPLTACRSAAISALRSASVSVGRRAEEHDVRNHLSSFFPFASQRLRTVCLKRPHFAFLASLYFCRGSLCSPPGRQFLSFFASIPRDFLYSAFGTHLRFSRDPGSGVRDPSDAFALRLPIELSTSRARAGSLLGFQSDLGFQSALGRAPNDLGFHSGPPSRFVLRRDSRPSAANFWRSGVNDPLGFHSGFSDRSGLGPPSRCALRRAPRASPSEGLTSDLGIHSGFLVRPPSRCALRRSPRPSAAEPVASCFGFQSSFPEGLRSSRRSLALGARSLYRSAGLKGRLPRSSCRGIAATPDLAAGEHGFLRINT